MIETYCHIVDAEVLKWWIVEYSIAAQDRTRKEPQYYAYEADRLKEQLKAVEKGGNE